MAKLLRAESGRIGPLPGDSVEVSNDSNVTRLIALWTRDTLHINEIVVDWRFGGYAGFFQPTAADREPGTPEDRLVYAYDPSPNGPFRQGVFRSKQWEAWTITAPSPDVTSAEISVFTDGPPQHVVMLGAAATRNGVLLRTDGPKPDAAHILVQFS